MEENRSSQETDNFNILRYYFILKRRFWLVVLIFALCVAGGIHHIRNQSPLYRTSLTLLIEPHTKQVVDFNDGTYSYSHEDYLNTQYKMLKSYSLSEKVYRAAGLSTDPEFENLKDPVEALRGMIRVNPLKDSWLVNVGMIGKVPRKVTKLLNMLGETYIKEHVNNRLAASREAFSWLYENVEELRLKLSESEKELQKFRENEKEFSLGDRRIMIETSIAEVNKILLEAKKNRTDLEIILETMEEHSGGAMENLMSVPTIAEHKQIALLKKEFLDLQAQKVELSRRYRPKHPEIRKLDGQLDNLRSTIREEVRKLIDGVRIEYQIQSEKEKAYQERLDSLKDEALRLDEKISRYSILEQEDKSNRQLFDVMLMRLKETELTENIPTMNIRIVDRAKVPREPFNKAWLKTLLLSIAIGLMLGTGAALCWDYLDDTVKTPEDIESITDVPFLGVVPKLLDPANNSGKECNEEPYRIIGTNLELELGRAGSKRILITSCSSGDGKTLTIKQLGDSLAQSGKQVLEIDGDLRNPGLHTLHGIPKKTGFSDLLMDGRNGNWKNFLKTNHAKNIRIMTAGSASITETSFYKPRI